MIWTRTPATPNSSNCSTPTAWLARAAESVDAWGSTAAIAPPGGPPVRHCGRVFDAFTATALQGTHSRPAQLLLVVPGVLHGGLPVRLEYCELCILIYDKIIICFPSCAKIFSCFL